MPGRPTRFSLLCLALPPLAIVTACATATPAQVAERDARQAALVPAATPTGPAVSCITTRDIRQIHVRNDSVIDFEMNNRRYLRNTLPLGCPRLGFEQRIGYRTTTGQLCSVDTITVLDVTPGPSGPTCGLGEFQPIALVEGEGARRR